MERIRHSENDNSVTRAMSTRAKGRNGESIVITIASLFAASIPDDIQMNLAGLAELFGRNSSPYQIEETLLIFSFPSPLLAQHPQTPRQFSPQIAQPTTDT